MGRKRKFSTVSLDEPFAPIVAKSDIADETPRQRLVFSLDESGNIDKEKLSPEDLEKLRAVLPPPPEKSADELSFEQDEVNAVLDLLTPFCAFGASKIYKVDRDIAANAFTYSEYHRKKLTPPMQKVLNKWGPYFLKKWKDEIGLGIVFLSVTNAQIRLMHTLAAQRKAEKEKPKTTEIKPILEPERPAAD